MLGHDYGCLLNIIHARVDGVVEVPRGSNGNTEESEEDKHRGEAPDELAAVVMEVVAQEGQGREVGDGGEPGEVDD